MGYLIISDLHLGAADELEDFKCLATAGKKPTPKRRQRAIRKLHRQFAALLSHTSETLRNAHGAPTPHLILLGDVADIWLTRNHRETIANALLRIMAAHGPVFAALRRWTAAGGRITWVLGNHDQPLVDPAAWDLLRQAIPGLNKETAGNPAHSFAAPQAGLYAEHGHQWDPLNRLRALGNPHADCPGRRIVRHAVRPLKPVLPFIDATTTTTAIAEQLWHSRLNPATPLLPEVAAHLQRLIGRAAGPARALWEELRATIREPEKEPDFTRAQHHEEITPRRRIRSILYGEPRHATGTLPVPFHLLAAGHTHRRGAYTAHHRHYINPGTWKPYLRRDAQGRWAAEQRLTYALVLQEPAGIWHAQTHQWGSHRLLLDPLR